MAPAILYLSQIVGKPVYDPENRPLGLLDELVVRLGGPFPPVTGLTVRFGGIGKSVASRQTFLHWADVASVSAEGIRLSTLRLNLAVFHRRQGEIVLRQDLLDQQVMDIHGRKLVRVNDVQLVAFNPSGSDLRLAGIDVGLRGLLRRLDADGLSRWLGRRTRFQIPDRVVPWEDIGPLGPAVAAARASVSAGPSASANGAPRPAAATVAGEDVGFTARHGLQLAREKLSTLHPADVADLVEQLSARDRAAVIGAMEAGQAAEALGELDPEMSADVLEDLPTTSAAEILAELPPDEAADALAELPAEKAHELLEALSAADAATVRHLMSFDEDVAGGMMTTDYVALPVEQTVQETIETLRRVAPPAEEIYSLYVVDAAGQLSGVLSLRDLIVAPPDAKLASIIRRSDAGQVVYIQADSPKEEVIRTIDKYNLLALPVTDEAHRLIGVITVDDALAAALPPEPRRILGVMK